MQYLVTNFMNWSELIETLVRDFRMSEPDIARLCGVTYPTITRIRSGKTKQPNQETIKRLETGLNIKIEDSDPENLTYKLISEVKEAVSGYGVPGKTEEETKLINKLKEMGIETVEELDKLCNYEDITEDIKEILKKRLGHKY